MKRMKKQAAAILASAIASVVGYTSQAATVTWVGTIADPNSATYTVNPNVGPGIFTDGQNLYLWNTSTLNFSSGGSPVAYSVGDDVVFTDDPAVGKVLRLTTSNMNPASVTFAHTAGGAAGDYYLLRSGDFLDSGSANVSSNTPWGAGHNSVLTLDTGFLGTVHIRSRAGAGLDAFNNTIIRSGTLEINDALPLPNNNNNNRPNVTLDGGTLSIFINTAGNTSPASGNPAGIMTVLSDSAMVLARTTTSESGGTVAESRSWQGTISMASGVTLNLMRNHDVRYRLPANLAAVEGTIKLLDGPGGLNNYVILENAAGAANATFDLGTGTSILETNQTGFQIGKVIGSDTTNLRGNYAFGGADRTDTIVPVVADRTAGATSISKIGTGTTTFTSANTYTGGTTVSAGTMVFSGVNGSAASTGSVTLTSPGTLKLDNSASSNNNRLNDNAAITLNGGNLEFVGNLASGTSEAAGTLNVNASSSTIRTVAAGVGASAAINFAGISRTAGIINFEIAPNVNVGMTNAPTLNDGIIGGWATVNGSDWANVSGGNVVAYSGYTGTFGATDNVLVTSAVAAGSVANSLKLSGVGASVAIGSGSLVVDTGGVLAAGTAGASITGPGQLTAGDGLAAAQLIATVGDAANTLTISAPIVDNTATGTVTLVKAGAGKLVLGGTNTFTGGISILAGSLAAGAANVLPATGPLTVDFGTTFDLAGFNQSVATVSLINGSIINSGGAATLSGSTYDVRNGTISAELTGSAGLTKTTGSTVTLAVAQSYTGGSTISAGRLVTGVNNALVGDVTVAGGTLDIGATNQSATNVILNGGGIVGTTGVLTSPNAFQLQNGSVTAILGGSSGVLKTSNSTVTLSALNTYTGVTDIQGGTVAVNTIKDGGVASSIGASGAGSANLLFNNGALNYTGTGDSTNRSFQFNGGTMTLNNNGTGSLQFTNTAAVSMGGSTLTLGGNQTGDNLMAATLGGGAAVTKANGGKWILSGANTYTGITTVSAGTLTATSLTNANSPSSIGQNDGSAGNLVVNGGALDYSGAGASTNRQFTVGTGNATFSSSGAGAVSWTNTAAVTYAGTTTRSVNFSGTSTANNTMAAAIVDVGVGTATTVNKVGAGKWVLSGANTYSGSTVVTGGTLVIATPTSHGLGTLNANGGTAQFQAGLATAAKVPSLAISGTGKVDMTNNDLVIDYTTGPNPTLTDTVRQHLAAGRLMTSSVTPAGTKLGYLDNAALGSPLASFGGITVDADSILIKYTYAGDSNLDGQVDITDLAALATAWQTSGVWVNGDFDYSGFIDITDLAALATNWQAGVGAPLAQTFEQALASVGLAGQIVPEPATLSLIGLGAMALMGRRRRA